MRLSNRSLGVATLFACASLPLGFFGCAREGSSSGKSESTGTSQAALSGTVVVPWGGSEGLSFHPGGDESATRGPSAFAFARRGDGFLVLDGLAHRMVGVTATGVTSVVVPELPRDADSFAVSPEGELAVHRAISAQIDLFGAKGQRTGSVPVPMEARDATVVHALSQGRIMLEHPFQERYLLGSPNVPRQPELVVPTRREGIAADFSTTGYEIVVRHPEGEEAPTVVGRAIPRAGSHAYLLEATPTGEPAEHGTLPYRTKQLLDLGETTSARIVGIVGGQACVVLEHVDLAASAVHVEREIAVVDLANAQLVGRIAIETPTLYTLRQEFAFDGKRIGQALPTQDGLTIRTIAMSEVTK